jgi:DNA-binding NtrC family response regulator
VAERLLLVEDREALRRALATALGAAFDVEAVADGATAVERLQHEAFAVVVSDVRLPGVDGRGVLAAARAREDGPEVVLMTAFADVPSAVAALRAGAYDYLAKPFEPEHLVRVAQRAAERGALLRRARALAAMVEPGGAFVGESAAAAEVRRRVDRVGGLAVPVLLVGEPGAGKEAVAQELHRRSGRGALVAVSCAAASEEALFGAAGALEAARGGTLLLDEVAELPIGLQARLSRALGDPVGAADLRVIATTARDLAAEGAVRQELLLQLTVVQIVLPPLRERREDIGQLAARALHVAAARYGTSARRLSGDALATLEAWDWPGNVRELQRAVEHAVALAEGEVVEVGHLPDELRQRAPLAPAGTWRSAMERAQEAAGREYLTSLLRRVEGNVTRAAAEAGLERESLHRLLRRHGLDAGRFRG